MSQHCYHCHAISWNDHGIECMKHREYQQAISHFHTALRCVKSLLTEEEDDSTNGDGIHLCHCRASAASYHHEESTSEMGDCCFHDSDDDAEVLSSDTLMMVMMTIPASVDLASPAGVAFDGKLKQIRPIRIALTTINDEDDTFDSMTFDRLTCILLYNLGICYIHAMVWQSHNNDATKSSSSLSLLPRASQVLRLSYELVQRMISSFGIVNESSFEAWYGLHQIEFRILSAMMFLMPSTQNRTTDADQTMIMINHRMVQVHHTLMRHRDLVDLLGATFPTTAAAAPCA